MLGVIKRANCMIYLLDCSCLDCNKLLSPDKEEIKKCARKSAFA
jgi:hypothetical protein